MPACGWYRAGCLCQCQMPCLHRPESLGIRLSQTAAAVSLMTSRHAALLGGAVNVRVYGTPRVFGATHVTAPVLTRRNRCELPTILHFDVEFQAAYPEEAQRATLTCVSPRFVEWLMGAPAGWTSSEPIDMSHVLAHRVSLHTHRPERGATASDPQPLFRLWPFGFCIIAMVSAHRVLRVQPGGRSKIARSYG